MRTFYGVCTEIDVVSLFLNIEKNTKKQQQQQKQQKKNRKSKKKKKKPTAKWIFYILLCNLNKIWSKIDLNAKCRQSSDAQLISCDHMIGMFALFYGSSEVKK